MTRRLPGFAWRWLAWGEWGAKHEASFTPADNVCFDELVVDDWFHIEQMNTRDWWMRLGDLNLNIHVYADGRRVVSGWWDGAEDDRPVIT